MKGRLVVLCLCALALSGCFLEPPQGHHARPTYELFVGIWHFIVWVVIAAQVLWTGFFFYLTPAEMMAKELIPRDHRISWGSAATGAVLAYLTAWLLGAWLALPVTLCLVRWVYIPLLERRIIPEISRRVQLAGLVRDEEQFVETLHDVPHHDEFVKRVIKDL